MNIAPSRFIQIGAIMYVISYFIYGIGMSSAISPLLGFLAFASIMIMVAGTLMTFYEPTRELGAIITLICAVLAAPVTFGGLFLGITAIVTGAYLILKEATLTRGKGTHMPYVPILSARQGLTAQPLCVYVRSRLAEGWRVYVTQRGEYVVTTPGGREAYSFLLEKDAVEFLSRTLGASAEEVKLAACP
ncbi:MAG: hypothetical protein LM577_07945 [Thermoproteaceae archaeon]|nr:hypothetical protein [Thermoproteaceae archaeon]